MSSSPGQTEELGAALITRLPAAAVVHLVGEIGVGKTTLVRGAVRALGVTGPVTSPTFTIANSYVGERELAHIDAWRLGAVDEEDIAAVLSSFGDEAVVFIEWPDVLATALPPALVRVELAHRSPEERLVRFRSSDSAISSAIARLIADTRARHGGSEPELGDPRRR